MNNKKCLNAENNGLNGLNYLWHNNLHIFVQVLHELHLLPNMDFEPLHLKLRNECLKTDHSFNRLLGVVVVVGGCKVNLCVCL